MNFNATEVLLFRQVVSTNLGTPDSYVYLCHVVDTAEEMGMSGEDIRKFLDKLKFLGINPKE